MSREYFELCYNQYEREMKDSDFIYQKAGVLLIVIPLLCTTQVKIGRIDILGLCFIRVDVFFFYFFTILSILCLISSVIFVLLCIYPRKYKTLANMDAWEKWRNDYQKYLNDAGQKIEDEKINEVMLNPLCQKLVEAQPINAAINEKRRMAFKHAIGMITLALTMISLQAICFIILKIQGVFK